MRILVDLTDSQIKELDAFAAKNRRSRASVLREAVDAYISDKKESAHLAGAFGLWRESETDGLACQEKLGSEW